MFTAYESFWKNRGDLRSRLESNVQRILTAATESQSSLEIVQQLQGTQELSELIMNLATYQPSGFSQPQAHIGALCAEMARNNNMQRSEKQIGKRNLVAFSN